jgi:hypothetical protein
MSFTFSLGAVDGKDLLCKKYLVVGKANKHSSVDGI